MRRIQSTLSGQHVCGLATKVLLGALGVFGWVASGGVVSPELLVQLLVRAGAERRSLDAIILLAKNLPSAETIRRALLSWLPTTTQEMEPVIPAALQGKLPKSLNRRPRTMAIDLHLKPYYGDKKTPGTYRGQRKASTKTFFAYATLLVIRKGQTFTVGLVPVLNGQELTTLIDKLLAQAAACGLKPRRLLLDRGFYAAKVMLHLQDKRIPFVMPMIRRGKSGKTTAMCTGTAQFFGKGRTGWATYVWKARMRQDGRRGTPTKVTTDVCMAPRKENGTPWVFACYGMNQMDPKQVVELYRKRFRIETSYRQMHEGLAMTCSKNPVYRLLLVLVAFVLRNLWLWLHWMLLADRAADGTRTLNLEYLRARQMMHWLACFLDQKLGVAKNLQLPNAAGAGTCG